MFITYAQNFEDLMLWRALSDISQGFYIDVGATSPHRVSVTKAFYLAGWRGINIEPEGKSYEELCKVRTQDTNLNVAISSRCGRATLYSVEGSPTLSSLSEWMATAHRKANRIINEVDVEVTTLADVCAKHVGQRDIHFLKVDVEGVELDVFQGHDFERWRPWIIVAEAHNSDPEADHYLPTEHYLASVGYPFVYTDGLNRFYVDQARRWDLRRAFLVPPNNYDNWIRASELEWRERAERAELNNHRLTQLLREKTSLRSFMRRFRSHDGETV
jgi:FkbM family methyltransferase